MSFEDSGLNENEYFGCSDIHATRPKWVARPSIYNSCPTKEELAQYQSKLNNFEQYKEDDAKWLVENQEQISQRDTEFFLYFCNYVGISLDHPKAATLLSKCWEEGYSSGYSEVLNVGLNLVELIL